MEGEGGRIKGRSSLKKGRQLGHKKGKWEVGEWGSRPGKTHDLLVYHRSPISGADRALARARHGGL